MTSLAKQLIEGHDDVYRDIGKISKITDDEYTVETTTGIFRTQRAVSCLVEPKLDDVVLFLGKKDGVLYIVAVLSREGDEPVTISSKDDLRLASKIGRIIIAAQNGVDVLSSRDISMHAHDLHINAEEGNVLIDKLLFLGSQVFSEVGKLKLKAGFVDSVIDRVSQRVKTSHKIVEILDHVRAGQVEWVAKNNMRLRGKNALVNADLLVKIDGDQIHLG